MLGVRYRTIDSLLETHPDGGVTFLMRHAERHPLMNSYDVIHADLTETGLQAAREFGARLHARVNISLVSSSPLRRCRNTCQAILEGAGQQVQVHGYWWLFSPFLRSPGTSSTNGGQQGVQFWSERSPGAPESIYHAERLALLSRRIQIPTRAGEIYLYVAHDTTVLPMLAYLTGRGRTDEQQMPGYLEGIALVRRDGVLALDEAEFYSSS